MFSLRCASRPMSLVTLTLAVLIALTGCSPEGESGGSGAPGSDQGDGRAALKQALTFHASFDDGPDASFAAGDRRIYTAPSYKEQSGALPGIGNPNVEIAAGAGKFGRALQFNSKNTHAIFYRGENNVAYSPAGWDGTVSFWLNLNPDEDLEPGYCDPIQVTDSAYNDAAVWVDFTKDEVPRHFRLGVFGDLEAWNPGDLPPDQNPDFTNRLVVVEKPPFERGKWTHVVITYAGLGGGAGSAKLYLDGKLQGSTAAIAEPFDWDLALAAIRVGVNYVGLFDELALFRIPLSDEQVVMLHDLPNGVADLHP